MRVAAIELFVAVRPKRRSQSINEGGALCSALFRDPQRRNRLAAEAIEASAELKPDVILCPGWTFVGYSPSIEELVRMTGGATLLYEVLTEAVTAKRYVIGKRRHGPWAALISTANNMDRTVLGMRSNFSAPAHGVVYGKDQVPLTEKPVGTDGSRVVLYDIEGF